MLQVFYLDAAESGVAHVAIGLTWRSRLGAAEWAQMVPVCIRVGSEGGASGPHVQSGHTGGVKCLSDVAPVWARKTKQARETGCTRGRSDGRMLATPKLLLCT
jgi:hypothetical protein